MALKGKLDKLQKAMRENLESFEFAEGRQYYFDPQEAFKTTFRFFTDCMSAEHLHELRPEPPEILRTIADAKDRRAALYRVMDGYSPIYRWIRRHL